MSATSTTFLGDLAAVIERGRAGGSERFAEAPVFVLEEGTERSGLFPVQRVGLTPEGAIVVLFRRTTRHGFLLPAGIR